jgi:hypothetical protein
MISLKDVPLKAIPFVILLAATAVFGELFIRIPTHTVIHQGVSFVIGGFTIISVLMFFSKVFFNFPRMRGLELD